MRPRRLFPMTFARIRRCKEEGIPVETLWNTLKAGVDALDHSPASKSAMIAEYHSYVKEVYGKREIAKVKL